MSINNLFRYKTFSCICNDGVSYPEKFIFKILEQLRLKFKFQVANCGLTWCKKYRYDFYFKLNNEEYIIEVHGMQHYQGGFESLGGKPYLQEEENDKLKKELAIANGIKEENYIVIDCRYSELNWIRNNVLNSRLNEIFHLSDVDWNKCGEFAYSNIVKISSNLFNEGNSIDSIAKITKFNANTIRRWLKQGSEIGWCDYNAETSKQQNYKDNAIRNKINFSNKLICLNNKKIYWNSRDFEDNSVENLGIKISRSSVDNVCKKRQKSSKGLFFKYISELTSEEYIKYDIENKLKELEEVS